jgi:hypothetical protein
MVHCRCSMKYRKITSVTFSGRFDLGTMPRTTHPLGCTSRPLYSSAIRVTSTLRLARLLHTTQSRRGSQSLPTTPSALWPRAEVRIYDRVFHPSVPSLGDFLFLGQLPILPRAAHSRPFQQVPTGLACENEAEFATHASSVDIDFDAISHTVDLSALWSADKDALSRRPGSGITDRAVVKYRESHRVEVGVLQNEPVKEVEELSLGGYLIVLGEHEKPSMFIHSRFKDPKELTVHSTRRNDVLLPISPPPSPSRTIKVVLRGNFPATNRSASQTGPHLPCGRAYAASAFMCPARLHDSAVCCLH